jgi:molybdopterin-binding protein
MAAAEDRQRGATTAYAHIDADDTVVTASITNAGVEALQLKARREAYATIEASHVKIGIDE